MTDSVKEKIKPLYGELIGYMAQAPEPSMLAPRNTSHKRQLDEVINQLESITGKDLSRFRVEEKRDLNDTYFHNSEYRSNLNGLIMALHSEYFFDKQAPFSGSASTVVSQSQFQTQAQAQALVLDMQSFIDKKLLTEKLDDKEKTFLQRLKEALPSVKTTIELIILILVTSQKLGLTIEQASKIFGR